MENVKTLGTMLQNIIEEDGRYFNLFDFLTDSTEEDRKKYADMLVDADYKQFFEFMDTYTFVNKDEVYMAVCEYYEKTIDRGISMGECGDMSEIAEDYMRERNLNFEEICEECGQVHSEMNDGNTTKTSEEIILPF